MTRHARILVHLEGPLLIGGYASATGRLDATTAADHDGVPVVPASTLKGALREACTRLARVDGNDQACTIDDPCGGKCLVCQLFGGPGIGPAEVLRGDDVAPGHLGGLFLGDARPSPGVETDVLRRSLRTRPGVGIDRWTHAAVPQVLYEREVLDAPGHVLVAPLRAEGLRDDAWDLFTRALRLVDGIGNSRSRGLGRVRLELAGPASDAGAHHVFPKRAPLHGGAVIEIEALEPLLLGGLPSTASFADPVSFIAGSALRGAFGTAAARLSQDARFQQVFVDPKTCLLFSDAYAVAKPGAPLPVPVPRSSLSCKHEKRADHGDKAAGLRDGLLALALADALRGFEAPRCEVAKCNSPLRTARGIYPPANPVSRVVTRLARDLWTGSAMPELLYTTTPFEPGTRFAGTVGRLTDDALEALPALSGEEIRIGRGRRRGQGLVRITVREDEGVLGPEAVSKRLGLYAPHVQGALELLGKAGGGAIAVLARTALALPLESAANEIQKALYREDAPRAHCVATAQSPAARSGWSDGHAGQKAGQRSLRPVVAEGSAWLFVHEPGVTLDPSRLSRLEIEGVGDHRELGFGRLAIAHELFVAAAGSPQEGN
jgi:CRISPR/Cas system CSM-associated protein Csm3 (group 7 of RAMP superfamily)